MIAALFSAIMTVGGLVLVEVIAGVDEPVKPAHS
jgi:hypothetical protein